MSATTDVELGGAGAILPRDLFHSMALWYYAHRFCPGRTNGDGNRCARDRGTEGDVMRWIPVVAGCVALSGLSMVAGCDAGEPVTAEISTVQAPLGAPTHVAGRLILEMKQAPTAGASVSYTHLRAHET